MNRLQFLGFLASHFCKGQAICKAKNADYSSADNEQADAFRNFRMEEILTGGKVTAEAGVLTRLLDKWSRAKTLSGQGYAGQVKDESIFDTARDGSVYWGIFAGIVYEKINNRERWDAENDKLRTEMAAMDKAQLAQLLEDFTNR